MLPTSTRVRTAHHLHYLFSLTNSLNLILLPSVVCGDFNSRNCSFLSSLGHQNIVDLSTRLDLVFINDVGTYVTHKRASLSSSNHFMIRVLPKVCGKLGKGTLLHQTKKVE